MCFCLIYFNLGNVSSCIDMYLGIFVSRTEVEVEAARYVLQIIQCFFAHHARLYIANSY